MSIDYKNHCDGPAEMGNFIMRPDMVGKPCTDEELKALIQKMKQAAPPKPATNAMPPRSQMTQDEYIQAFRDLASQMTETTRKKNADYGDPEDALSNFRLIQELTGGRISMEDGVLVRITDKVARMAHLLGRTAAVQDEALDDTAVDGAVYMMILAIMLRRRSAK